MDTATTQIFPLGVFDLSERSRLQAILDQTLEEHGSGDSGGDSGGGVGGGSSGDGSSSGGDGGSGGGGGGGGGGGREAEQLVFLYCTVSQV